MARKLKNLDRDTPMLLPVDLRDWIPDSHIVHFLIDAVDRLPEASFRYNWRGSGSDQYPPRMMLVLLIYCYVTGRFSSRSIEAASYSDVVVRYICGGNLHPDHDTLCTFRRQNKELFSRAFVEVLLMASELGSLSTVGTVSIDGTKIKANASRHAAVSYDRAAQQIEMLRAEVAQLEVKAEAADSTPLEDGLSLPEEIQRRSDRIAKLDQAREAIRQRYAREEFAEKQASYEACKARRDVQRAAGKIPKGKEPSPPSSEPPARAQINFTDAQSRILKSGIGYEQCYNAQAGVDTESLLIVEQYVTERPNDKRELGRHLEHLEQSDCSPAAVLCDSGYFSEAAVEAAESNPETPAIYAATGRTGHRRSVTDLEVTKDPPAPDAGASTTERMRHRLRCREGRTLYRLRKQTVEPVFGIIKEAMGFRHMSMRGQDKADTEWTLVCLSYNLKRLFTLSAAVCPRSSHRN